jgi:hypothetical protein
MQEIEPKLTNIYTSINNLARDTVGKYVNFAESYVYFPYKISPVQPKQVNPNRNRKNRNNKKKF